MPTSNIKEREGVTEQTGHFTREENLAAIMPLIAAFLDRTWQQHSAPSTSEATI